MLFETRTAVLPPGCPGGPSSSRRRSSSSRLKGERVWKRRIQSGDGDSQARETRLGEIVKRKKERVERSLREMGDEALEDRLTEATMQGPGESGFRFSTLVASVGMRRGGPLAIFEVGRLGPTETSEQLAARAKKLVEAGADAISVRVDEEYTPEGTIDLFFVSRSVAPSVPCFARDWILHPIQVVDLKAAGATGVIGVVASVTQRGSPVLSSFGAALGLDMPVEVVNLNELKQMEGFGVPFFAMDIGVGINVGIAGFTRQLISGVLGEMDFNALSIVGVSSIGDLHSKIATKADALYIKAEIVAAYADGREADLVSAVLDACSGDD